MIRRMAQTVRWPVARMAPTARAWALVQTQWENSGAKAARMTTISGGRSTGVVSEVEGSCITVDHRRRPLGLPVNFEWNGVGQLAALDKVEFQDRRQFLQLFLEPLGRGEELAPGRLEIPPLDLVAAIGQGPPPGGQHEALDIGAAQVPPSGQRRQGVGSQGNLILAGHGRDHLAALGRVPRIEERDVD